MRQAVLGLGAQHLGDELRLASANAIRALNRGAAKGGFYHDTGEGSISPYHREGGGDLVWEIGSGYFGCRTTTAVRPEPFRHRAPATIRSR